MTVECALGLLAIVIALFIVLGGVVVVLTGWSWWEYNKSLDNESGFG